SGRSGHPAGAESDARAVADLDPQHGVAGEVFLTRTATRPLARYDRAPLEDLSTPHTPWLGPLDGAREALDPERASAAQGLRDLEVGRHVGEPQIRVVLAAR